MATSEVAICNRALAQIGTRSTIASLTEDSNEANNCNLIFDSTRDELLSMAFWNFAKKTDYLSLLKSAPGTPSSDVTDATAWSTDYPAPPWLYEYSYPSDCLQIRYLIPQIQTGMTGVPLMSNTGGMYPYVQGPAARFEAASDVNDQGARINVVLTNQYQAIGVYTVRVTDPNIWSSTFIQAMVCALAAKLAVPLTGSLALARQMYGLANQQVIQARASDGNEGLTVIDNEASWISARDVDGLATGYGYWISPFSSLYAIF